MNPARTVLERLKNNNYLTNREYKEYLRIIEAELIGYEMVQTAWKNGTLSDGYYTFNELYEQRMYLFATIVKQNKAICWKSYKHNDGELCFGGGWFIVGIDTPEGSYTYHYKNEYWDLFDCVELECGKYWDGHNFKDITRLLSLFKREWKLSEIVERLQKEFDDKLCVEYTLWDKVAIGRYYNDYDEYFFDELVVFGKDMKIDNIYLGTGEKFKWLYGLWLDNANIIDDMGER